MRESDVKEDIVREIRKEGGYARRIEDRFTVGQPDMFLVPKLCPAMWVEVKVVRGNIIRPTPRQLVELDRLFRPPHCTSFLLGWKEGVLYIAPPSDGVNIIDCIAQRLNQSVGDLIRRAVKEDRRG
jgi:hypothetical protein